MFRMTTLSLFFLCSCQRTPCDEIDVSNLSINTFFETPSFSWVGDNINSLSVKNSNDEELWWIECSGASQCISSPVTYGEPPEFEDNSLKASEATQNLSTGETYTLRINVKCKGNGRNILQEEEFVAP